MKFTLELTDQQMEVLAEAVAAKMTRGDSVLTVHEAAKRAKMSAETIRRWIRAGRLPKVQGTRTIRIPAEQLDRLLLQEKAPASLA